MADPDLREGIVLLKIQHIDTPCHTYYKIIGDLSSNWPRLIVLHGGPGTGHEYLLPFGHLWQQFGIPVVFYDQIGCVASTHLPQTTGDEYFWQESLFLAELDNLVDFLQLRGGPGYHILGHSWGRRIAVTLATTKPLVLQ
jgi:L-proline amide hydrolase